MEALPSVGMWEVSTTRKLDAQDQLSLGTWSPRVTCFLFPQSTDSGIPKIDRRAGQRGETASLQTSRALQVREGRGDSSLSASVHLLLLVSENIPCANWGQGHSAKDFIFQPRLHVVLDTRQDSSEWNANESDWCKF